MRRLPRGRRRPCAARRRDALSEAREGVRARDERRGLPRGAWAGDDGPPLAAESADSLSMTMLVKRASNGLPVNVDVLSPEACAALARGRATFNRRAGERNHSCANCHTPEAAAGKFLGGRVLVDVRAGLTRHFPTWRT